VREPSSAAAPQPETVRKTPQPPHARAHVTAASIGSIQTTRGRTLATARTKITNNRHENADSRRRKGSTGFVPQTVGVAGGSGALAVQQNKGQRHEGGAGVPAAVHGSSVHERSSVRCGNRPPRRQTVNGQKEKNERERRQWVAAALNTANAKQRTATGVSTALVAVNVHVDLPVEENSYVKMPPPRRAAVAQYVRPPSPPVDRQAETPVEGLVRNRSTPVSVITRIMAQPERGPVTAHVRC